MTTARHSSSVPSWPAYTPSPSIVTRPAAPECRSAAYRATLERVRRFARDRNAPILIEGESGTGKTTLARALHQQSPRAAGPFHSVVLSTLDDSLASSELFGHIAGAFTDARQSRSGHFASANGGTLFLDEIGKASVAIQQKLLHAVEYGEIRAVGSDRDIRVDVRIVVATNVSLAALVESGRFLPDLYARIQLFRIVLPTLRERRSDIPVLATHYVQKHAAGCGYGSAPSIDPELMRALENAPWPANLRQLDCTMHRLLVEAEGHPVLSLRHCTDDLAYLNESTRAPLSRERVDAAIAQAGTVSGAAKLLGVDRTTVHRFQRRQGVAPHSPASAPGDAPHGHDPRPRA